MPTGAWGPNSGITVRTDGLDINTGLDNIPAIESAGRAPATPDGLLSGSQAAIENLIRKKISNAIKRESGGARRPRGPGVAAMQNREMASRPRRTSTLGQSRDPNKRLRERAEAEMLKKSMGLGTYESPRWIAPALGGNVQTGHYETAAGKLGRYTPAAQAEIAAKPKSQW